MKTGKNVHNLGSRWRPGSQDWYYLVFEDSGGWHVEMEKDYDAPDREGYTQIIKTEDLSQHQLDDKPLIDVISQKMRMLGNAPNLGT